MTIETPWGPATYELDSNGALVRLYFGSGDGRRDGRSEIARQLAEYFRGTRRSFDLPLAPEGSDFQKCVWTELVRIPFGQTISYSELAQRIGLPPGSARAVGRANATNPIWLIVPCHRVIGANGSLTGYAGGLLLKKRMLMWEREVVEREFALTPPPASEAAAVRG